MDEHNHYDNCFLCNHPILKHTLIGILVFLGAFAAFYVVTDWHFKRMLDPAVQMRKMEKMMLHDQRKMDNMIRREARKDFQFERKAENFIRVEKNADNYKIIIDLRPFDNDEKNVEVTANGNVLTVTAAGESKKHGHEMITKVSQNFMFDDNVDLSKINKIREGHDYIIFVPVE
ncbi:TPA: hypothetical protein IAC10_13590 [Candidatus Scatousia excrementigallinarum]|uniref:SHSP domain-containing protein n=1 Tax=Candidatus Scatousia excrementigallinarum TaxID=2840935 RepID=A0A9D1F145_9BACT|nr:hypothetical protein [Candidatus Scatousia excrementigallinarum]